MEVALYHSKGGYYSRGSLIDREKDYYTSPAAHPAFGALISVALYQMWNAMDRPYPFHSIEMGAGTGILGSDVTRYAKALPKAFRKALRYVALERCTTNATPENQTSNHQRVITIGMPVKGIVGCILSNELVDSFPVHRFQIQQGSPKEIFLTVKDELISLLFLAILLRLNYDPIHSHHLSK